MRGRSARGVSSLLSLSIASVAISLLVMLVALSIILGFKQQVASVAYSQTGHISLYASGSAWTNSREHISLTPDLQDYLRSRPEVKAVYPLLQQTVMLKTEEDFLGLMLYGVDSAFDYKLFGRTVIAGTIPTFSQRDTVASPIVLPSKTAQRLRLNLGDTVRLYFLGESIRVRTYQLVAIYDSHGLEDMPALCSARSLRRIHKLTPEQYSRAVIFLHSAQATSAVADTLTQALSQRPDLITHSAYALSTAEELIPSLFQWLTLLDSNVVFLSVIMLIIGAFTMVTGLIITVLDKTEHIGVLKALGATNRQIRRIFSLIALRLILRGLLWGNAAALTLCLVQQQTQLVKLDPKSYFMDAMPILIDPWLWLGVNVGTLAFILMAIILPTYIISSIKPADIMRID